MGTETYGERWRCWQDNQIIFLWFVLIFHKLCDLPVKKCFHINMFYLEKLEEKWLRNSNKTTTYRITYCKMLHYSIKKLILLHTIIYSQYNCASTFYIMIFNWLILLFSESQNNSVYLCLKSDFVQGIGMCVQYIIQERLQLDSWKIGGYFFKEHVIFRCSAKWWLSCSFIVHTSLWLGTQY